MKRMIGAVLICLAASAALGDSAGTAELARADNRFAFNLLSQLAQGHSGQNIFISPYSVASALQMLDNGAAGTTKTEIQKVLKTADVQPAELNGACQELNKAILSQSNVILDLANGIWYNRGFELKPDFVSTNREFFQAELASVNFQTPEAAQTINRWADKKTDGKIKDIVAFPFPANTQAILANAIYFKGKWAASFDPRQTRPRDFYPTNGVTRVAPMMSQHREFLYQKGDQFQAVELPYAGDRMRMILFLPTVGSTPSKLVSEFRGATWDGKVLPGFMDREGTLVFPKFRLDYEVNLNQPLQAMGMRRAFIPGSADFSAMSNDPLFVSQVKQKSYADVNEEGTEAAAVTTVTVRAMAVMRPLSPFQMIVNRPFLFVIEDQTTQVILFLGIVNDPTVEN